MRCQGNFATGHPSVVAVAIQSTRMISADLVARVRVVSTEASAAKSNESQPNELYADFENLTGECFILDPKTGLVSSLNSFLSSRLTPRSDEPRTSSGGI